MAADGAVAGDDLDRRSGRATAGAKSRCRAQNDIGRRAAAGSSSACGAAAAPVPTQPPGPVHIVTFVDITPNIKDAGTAYCKQYVADTRKDTGVTSVQLLAQTNRPNHLVIYEVWQNQAAYEKHTTLAHTKDFHAKMVPIIGSPFDERPHYVVP